MPAGAAVDELAIERWFRSNGLPYLVPVHRWGREMPRRVAPFIVFATMTSTCFTFVDDVVPNFSVGTDELSSLPLTYLVIFGVFLVGLGVPALFGLFTAMLIRRVPRAATPLALVFVALLVFAEPIMEVEAAPQLPWTTTYAYNVLENLVICVAVVLATWAGLGSLAGWVVRASLRQWAHVARIAARTLPLVTVVVLLSMFSSPLWTVSDSIGPDRVAYTIVFFFAVGIIFVTTFVWAEVGGLHRTLPSGAELAVHLAGTPAEGAQTVVADSSRGLRRAERLNMAATVILSMAFQVAALCLLVLVTLLVFASIILPANAVERLIAHAPAMVSLLGIEVPVPVASLNIALVLAGFAGMQFFIQLGSNSTHRDAFYEPLLVSARSALAVRAVYRAQRQARRRRGAGARPAALPGRVGAPEDEQG